MSEDSDFDDRPDDAKRLTEARLARGFADAKSAAKFFNWNYNSYAQHENGFRGLRKSVAEKYARAFRVSPGWLTTGEGRGPLQISAAGKTQPRDLDSSDTTAPGNSRILGRDGTLLARFGEYAVRETLKLPDIGRATDEDIHRLVLEILTSFEALEVSSDRVQEVARQIRARAEGHTTMTGFEPGEAKN